MCLAVPKMLDFDLPVQRLPGASINRVGGVNGELACAY